MFFAAGCLRWRRIDRQRRLPVGCERHATGYRAQIGGRIRDLKELCFNWNCGAGVNLNFAAGWTVDVRWERHRMDFAGGGENLDPWSAGLNYRF